MEKRVLDTQSRHRVGRVLWVIVCGFLAVALLVACGAGDPYVSVIEGNYAYGQGRYQDATVHYLQAMSSGKYANWISYDLANVYHSLGESKAALQMWKRASKGSDATLRYGISYNLGVQYYELGEYQKAYDSFRTALEYDPASMNAKINLELSLQKLQPAAETAASAPVNPKAKPTISNQDSQRVLDYVRRKEAQEWVPGKRQPTKSAVNNW